MPAKKVVIVSKKKYQKKASPVVSKAVKAYVKKELKVIGETKQSISSSTDNIQIPHNFIYVINSTLLTTSQGVQDPINANGNNRIGDEINLRGIKIKLHLQLNERYSQVHYRVWVVRSAKGDTPTQGTFFAGISSNKYMDTLNNERFKIIHKAYGKIDAGNFGGQTVSGGLLLGGGLFDVGGTNVNLYSPQSRIVSMWIPASKITSSKYGKVRYENITSQPMTFDYHLIILPYSSSLTNDAGSFNILTINETIVQMYFKDP